LRIEHIVVAVTCSITCTISWLDDVKLTIVMWFLCCLFDFFAVDFHCHCQYKWLLGKTSLNR